MVYIKDVAQVHMGYAEQTNIVRENGKRSALLTVLKNGDTSTLDIVAQTKAAIPRLTAGLGNLTITPLFDQSIFVRSSISEVVREATIAALLTGLMILLFLGSWRSTVIVCISIPLSIATSLIVLAALGQTINVMTLGGLALAVGILVDDANRGDREHAPQHGGEAAADAGHPALARSRWPRRRSSPRCPSASSLCRWCCSPVLPGSCSRRWRWLWPSP